MRRLSCITIIPTVLMLVLPCVGSSRAGEPPKEPILRIETGGHTARIERIGIDAADRYLVTASIDKTVRLWELATGKIIKVFRPPIGEGNEGRIDSVAISPDGRTVACGGWTKYAWEGSFPIYLFDPEVGRLVKRITGLPNVILHLAYSKDGRFLSAALGGSNGIRVFHASDYSLAGEDRDYGSDSYGADFAAGGRLVTTSFDGFIRLYGADFKLIAKKKAPGGNQPFAACFSPDGTKIAVGFFDSTKVDILSGVDLSHLYSPDTRVVNNGFLTNVAWSSDGRFLYAGGGYNVGGSCPIIKWADEGRGESKSLPAASSTIFHILALKKGGIVYGAADPAFGLFGAGDRRVVYQSSAIADYRNNLEGFLISRNGDTVQFGYEVRGKSPARFSLGSRLLELNPARGAGLSPPVTSAAGLNITDWKGKDNPKLNDQELKLQRYERSISLAISPDGETFLLGTEWNLRLFDRNGSEKWKIPVPAVAWVVNISSNGKVAVASFADGTIRWYRLADGRELLAFFPHNDKKRWTLWTPSGYYDASPGAEDLIGWHLNKGRGEAADFFPVSRFRATYYRPDVLAKVMDTLDEKEAIRLANEESGRRRQEATIQQMLPPLVEIAAPRDGTEVTAAEITVRFSLRSPSGEPVTNIRILVDGRPAAVQRGISIVPKDRDIREMKVTIPERDAEISVIAENRYTASDPATVRVRWRGETKREEFIIKPKLYVLSIGVSKYEDKDLRLSFASKDARDFAGAMTRQKGGLYRDVTVKVLADEKATRDEIMDGLDWLTKETTSKDIAMVFLAGHGVNDPGGLYYFLPVNANTEKLKRTGVVFSDIKNTVASLAGKTILFVDTCHSGNVMGMRRGVADINAVVNELASAESGAVVFASSTGKQYALEDPAWGNGAFTKALVEGISGKADYHGKGKITVNMLDLFLSERVKELTKGKQTPTTTKPQTIPDFPIAVRVGD